MKNIWNEIVTKTRQFVHDAGFSKVVLGLSGGIDSAVVACIATEAFGTENVLGVMMPSPYSSMGSVYDAQHLADKWGFGVATHPITPLMRAFDLALAPAFGGQPSGVTQENLQARIRAVLLMAICNQQDRLLLNTCNRSEDYTGYCTLYGDSCGAVAPIGGLYKTEVYRLAEWINHEFVLPDIPEAILTKAPSAELSEGQLDSDDLPPYKTLDAILKLHVDWGWSEAEILKHREHDPDTVRRILKLVETSKFKRDQSSPVIEITGGAA